MAVADAAAPPPPPWIVVALLAPVRFVIASLAPVFVGAATVIIYLGLASQWVLSAAAAAWVVASRACSEGSAPLVFFEEFRYAAFKACVCFVFLCVAITVVLLCGQYLLCLVDSEYKKKVARGAIARKAMAQEFLKIPRAMILGFVASLALLPLCFARSLVMIVSPPVEGSISQGEIIASVVEDAGIFGFHAIFCFVTIPALALHCFRLCRKAGLTW